MNLYNYFLHLVAIIYACCLFNNVNAENTPDYSDPNWEGVSNEIKDVCKSLENVVIPPEDLPNSKDLATLKGCNAQDLYYGFDKAPDYTKARHCAHSNKDYDILTMIYANGKGVSRNLDIAIHYACRFGGAPAEITGRINHLLELKKATADQKKDFDICDDITSGYMMGQCAAIEAKFKDAKRKTQDSSGSMKLSPQQQKAYVALQKAFNAYLDARSGEVDMSGSARAVFVLEAENAMKDRLAEILKDISQCKIPTSTPDQYQAAEKQMTTLYKRAQDKKYPDVTGIDKQDIQKAQNAWLKYREAWVTFGRLKCPTVTKESWQTLMTKDRIAQLQSLLEIDD